MARHAKKKIDCLLVALPVISILKLAEVKTIKSLASNQVVRDCGVEKEEKLHGLEVLSDYLLLGSVNISMQSIS